MGCQFIFDEDQEIMETQPLYRSNDGGENTIPCSSTDQQLLNDVPDSKDAITQLIESQHEQLSASGNANLQDPPTLPISFLSDDEGELYAPIVGNPNSHSHPIQMCQQLSPIPVPPKSPNPENRGQRDIFRPTICQTLLQHPITLFQVSQQ